MAKQHLSVRQFLICQVTVEVHRAVEDPNDLKRLPLDGEEDDVLLVAGGAATFCQVFPQSKGFRTGLDFGEFCPKTFQVAIFLFRSPSMEGKVGNFLQIANRRGREDEIHRLALASLRNSLSRVMIVPSPR